MASSSSSVEYSSTGFSKAGAYDQHRPSYSPSHVDTLLDKLHVRGKHHARILDLAAGTGKFTEALAARDEEFEVVAVEPVANMREVLARKNLKRVEVVEGQAEAIPSEDAKFDAVVCAQSFHWFASLPSLREIHRVLHRHGALGLIWNIDHYNAPREHAAASPWEARLHALLWTQRDNSRHNGDKAPRYRDMQWLGIFDQQVKKTPLSLLIASDDQMFALPVGQEKVEWELRLTREELWERFGTLSHVAVLEGQKREEMHESFMEAVSGPDVEEDQDGKLVVHGYTHLVWTTVIPSEGRPNLTEIETPGT